MAAQLSLFDPPWPEGLAYEPEVVSPQFEEELVGEIGRLDLVPFEFHGHLGHRKVAWFGWRYDYGGRGLRAADPIPDYLMRARDAVAGFARRPAEDFEQILVTEYPPGAGIGWHRDKAQFGEVVGLSLLSPCTLRFRNGPRGAWERRSLEVAPRSAYLLTGPARSAWEHSIPGVAARRCSITFRTLAAP